MVAESGSTTPGPDSLESPAGLQITKEFLEVVFSKPVQSFVTKSGSNAGDNYSSILNTVNVTFEDGKEENIVIKSLPTHAATAGFLGICGFFQREYFVYSELFPELRKTAGKSNSGFEIAAPKFHGGNIPGDENSKFANTPWEKETFVIMTDVRESDGYRCADRRQGLDLDHLTLVIKQLATIHALSWTHKKACNLERLTEKYPILKDFAMANPKAVETCGNAAFQIMKNATATPLELVKEVLGSDHPAYQGLHRVTSEDLGRVLQLYLSEEGINEDEVEELLRVKPDKDGEYIKDKWMVATHGDSWCNNFLFKYENHTGKPIDVALIDFQITREVCPTLDLAYLLHGSVRTKIRKEIEKQLLALYYKVFCDVCSATNTDVMPGFTLDNLQRRYRRSKVFGVLYAIPCLSLFMLPPEVAVNQEEDFKTGETFGDIMGNCFSKGVSTELKDELVELTLDLWEQGVL